MPLIGTRVTKEICFNPSEALARSRWRRFISMEFLHSFPWHHFARKPVVLLENVSCLLRLVLLLPNYNNCPSFHLSIIVSNFCTALKALNNYYSMSCYLSSASINMLSNSMLLSSWISGLCSHNERYTISLSLLLQWVNSGTSFSLSESSLQYESKSLCDASPEKKKQYRHINIIN